MRARALIRREVRETSVPSVTRVVICVSRAFLLDGPRKRETARSLHLAFFMVFVNTQCRINLYFSGKFRENFYFYLPH